MGVPATHYSHAHQICGGGKSASHTHECMHTHLTTCCEDDHCFFLVVFAAGKVCSVLAREY